MAKTLSIILTTLILGIISANASVYELPSKTINGKEYYYYTVQAKESIYSIASKLSISKDEIVKHNPSTIDGVRPFDILYFPKESASGDTTSQDTYTTHTVSKKETVYGISRLYGITVDQLIALNPSAKDGFKAGEILIISKNATAPVNSDKKNGTQIPAVTTDNEKPADNSNSGSVLTDNNTIVSNEAIHDSIITSIDNAGPLNIAIMLPFMLNKEKPAKQDKLYTDFYRGFLLALNRFNPDDIIVRVYDTADSLSLVNSILDSDELRKADVIIAPEDQDHFDAIASFASRNKCYVLNMFNIKDNSHMTNPYVLQANIPQDDMYARAIDYIIENYDDATPVFLRNKEHLSDKIKFTTQLQVALDTADIAYTEIAYSDILNEEDLAVLNDTTSYVFIPTSATKNDLISSVVTLNRMKENSIGRDITIFGYPEWITFKGSTAERLKQIEATYYSRFRPYNGTEFDVQEFEDWFNCKPILSYPTQALLGFDTARFIINATKSDGTFNPEYVYEGLQSDFHFVKTDGNAGYCNHSLMFITERQ